MQLPSTDASPCWAVQLHPARACSLDVPLHETGSCAPRGTANLSFKHSAVHVALAARLIVKCDERASPLPSRTVPGSSCLVFQIFMEMLEDAFGLAGTLFRSLSAIRRVSCS